MNKLISLLALASLAFVVLFATVARADTFNFDRHVVTRTTIAQDALRAEVDRRADLALGENAFVFVSAERVGEVTTIHVTVEAGRLTQRDELRLETAITEALRSPRVVQPVRFFRTQPKH